MGTQNKIRKESRLEIFPHLVVVVVCLNACLPHAKVLTREDDASYPYFAVVKNTHDYFVADTLQGAMNAIVRDEQIYLEALDKKINKDGAEYMRKLLHKTRSMRAYADFTRCYVPLNKPQSKRGAPAPTHENILQADWRKRFATLPPLEVKGDDGKLLFTMQNRLVLDKERFCHVFLNLMKEMMPGHIDLAETDATFYKKVMKNNWKQGTDGEGKALNTAEMQKLLHEFRQVLVALIIATNEAAMGDYVRMFPFVSAKFETLCRAQFLTLPAGKVPHRFKNINKTICKQLSYSRLKNIVSYREKIPNHDKGDVARDATRASFVSLKGITEELNKIIANLNARRKILDATLQMPWATKKGSFMLPWFKFINEVDFADGRVVTMWEEYSNELVEYAKRGYLSFLLSDVFRKKGGSIHLNRKGEVFGFGRVKFSPLKPVDEAVVSEILAELQKQLVESWLSYNDEINAALDREKLFHLAVSNDLVVARLLMQDPSRAVALHEVLYKQYSPCTPKWLRTYQNFALIADLGVLGVGYMVSFASGGVLAKPMLMLSNAMNFLWVGAALARERVAARRYKMLKRAVVVGASNADEGFKRLAKLQRVREELRFSAGVGATMTLTGIGILAKTAKLSNLALAGVSVSDIGGAFASDVGGIVSDDDPAELITGDRGDTCREAYLRK